MLHHSKVRKTAFSLIYAIIEQGYDEQHFPYEHFWEITLEKDYDRLRESLSKSILHACRASADVAGAFLERTEAFLLEAKGNFPLLPLREEVERCVERTKALQASLSELRLCLKDKRRDGTAELEKCNTQTLRLVQTICALGNPLLLHLDDEPSMRPAMESIAGALRRWLRLLSECSALSNPESLRESVEYSGLASKASYISELRPAAEKLAQEVMSHREELETTLHRLLRNYVPERLDAVDKGILYICLYELIFRRLSVPIAISEANNLAHEYSGSKSAPFIHGVLAAAALELTDTTENHG